MATTRKDVGAVTEPVTAPAGQPAAGPEAAKAEEAPRPFLSEGVRQDLEIHGKAVDPATGNPLEMDKDTGRVTVTDKRTGGKRTL